MKINLAKKQKVRNEICEKYDWNTVTDKTLEVYQYICDDFADEKGQYILDETKRA
jgi:hypothetical protein